MGSRSTGDAGFDAFWAIYPRKVAKRHALRMWLKHVSAADEQDVIEAAAEFAVSDVGRGEFCPHPGTWLHDGRWEDDRSEWYDLKAKSKIQYDASLFSKLGEE